LRWSEKYTKTDMVYLAKGGFWLGLGQIVSSASIFLLAIAFANLVPKEIYGTFKYILSLTGIFTVITLRGMSTAVTQAVARGYEGALIPAVKTKIRWGLLGGLASLILAGYYYFQGNAALAISFLIASVFLPFMDSFGIYNSFLQGKKLFSTSAIYGTASQILATCAMALSLLLTNNLFIILLVYFSSWTILRFACFILALKKQSNQRYDTETISYGKHSSAVNIIDTIIGSLDNPLIFHYVGAIGVAIYSFALAPISLLKNFFDQIPILAMPKLAQRPIVEINSLLWKRFFLLFGIGVTASLAYILVAPYIFKIFFPRYLDAIFFSQIFSLSIPLSLPQFILGAAITSRLTITPKKLLYLWNIPGIVFTVSIFILITKFGILGVIISKLLSLVAGIVVCLILWQKITKIEKHLNKIGN